MDNQWFPLLGTPFAIDRRLLNEDQAKRNHYQTLDQLARRGGLCPIEAQAVVERRAIRCSTEMQEAFAALIAASKPTTPAGPQAMEGECPTSG